MKIMQVTVEVARAEAASAEVLVLLHCEGDALTTQDTARLDKALDAAGAEPWIFVSMKADWRTIFPGTAP